jgi:transketolase
MTTREMPTKIDLSTVTKKATRSAYGEALLEVARRNPKVVGLAADCARGVIDDFRKEFPDRFFNLGIAEQNLIGVSAGLANSGLLPFALSYSPFLSMRSIEQIRDDVAYPNLNVKVAAMLGGVSQSLGGTTHHATEDFAILRSVANMTLIVPADAIETHKATLAVAEHVGPVYLRMGRNPEPLVYSTVFSQDYDYVIGKAVTLREGNDVTLIAAGTMVFLTVLAADLLAKEGISARVLNMHTVKPIDQEAIVSAARETGRIVTVEEHNIYGGLGGAVAEVVVSSCPVPMRIMGIPDVYVGVGPHLKLLAKYGICPEGIAGAARELLD